MEFEPTEVYANESKTRDPLENDSDEEAAGGNQVPCEGLLAEPRRRPRRPNRTQQLAIPDYMPPIPEKGAAFEIFLVVPDKGVFGGRHDGTLMHWKIQQSTSLTPLNSTTLRGHTGAVTAIDFCSALSKEGLLFTGSADRCVKVWDPWKGTEAEQQLHGGRVDHFCVQTIPAHEASVTSVKVMTQQRNGFASCSLDHTIKLWYPAEGRGLLLYPWFLPMQTINLTSGNWPTSLCIRDAATTSLFVGDSSGCVSHYTCGNSFSDLGGEMANNNATKQALGATAPSGRTRYQFTLKRKHTQFHSLGIVHLRLVADCSFVVSLGFDHKAQVLDAITGSISSTITNRNPVRFTSCSWDTRGQLLFLADAMGFVHLWNVYQDKWVLRHRLFPSGTAILHIHLHAALDCLFLGTSQGMKQWRINRDVGYVECPGHADAIVGFAVIKDEVLVDLANTKSLQLSRQMTTTSRFFSASLDSTLRCWDSYDMKPAFGFEERQSEITCIATSRKFAKIVTGHDSGCVKAWGIHTGHFVSASVDSRAAVTCVTTAMVRDQEFVVVGDVDGNAFIFELNADSLSWNATISASPSVDKRDEITAILFCNGDFVSPDGGSEFLLLGYHTGQLAIWSFARKGFVRRWRGHDDAVCGLVRHGCFVFSSSDDCTVKMWNCIQLAGTYELGVLRPPGSPSTSSTGSPIIGLDIVASSGAVLCAAADGTIVVWDYKGFDDEGVTDDGAYGKTLHRTRIDHQLRCMRYWPTQRAMLCGTNEGKILIIQLPEAVFLAPPVLLQLPG